MTGLLYQPMINCNPGELQICEESRDDRLTTARFRFRKRRTITNYTSSMEFTDQPFHTQLLTFGNLIPHQASASLPSTDQPTVFNQRIEVSLLCFGTLHNVAEVKIKWVDVLSLHLDFDPRTRQLSIFKFPSFCLLMLSCDIMTVHQR